MAKKEKEREAPKMENVNQPVEAPPGFKKISNMLSVDGYNVSDSNQIITGTALGFFESKTKLGNLTKTVVVSLSCNYEAKATGNTEAIVLLEPEQHLGISVSAGLRDLLQYQFPYLVHIVPTGEKKTGKPSPMKTYDVFVEEGAVRVTHNPPSSFESLESPIR